MKFKRPQIKKPSRPALISFILAIIVGFLLVTQFLSTKRVEEVIDPEEQKNSALEVSILAESNENLRDEVSTLEEEQQEYDMALLPGADSAEALESSLQRYQKYSGLEELRGSGVIVSIEGPVLDVHLLDLINNLRNIGVQGISLNGQRVIYDSFIRSQDLQIRLDGIPLVPPYRFEAIGDKDLLAGSLEREGGLLEQLKQTIPELQINVNKKDELTLAPYRGEINFEYAQVVE
ncbi:DUF881 domain-containing protein [Patescibacteria group bacterium]